MSEDESVPEPRLEPMRRNLMERVSIVWIVPIGALAISLGIAWQNWSQRGPVIEIAFENAGGIEAGATELRYREVAVGLVEDLKFSPALDRVIAEVRIEDDVAPYVDDDAEFWIVQPEVSAQGISGLGTVLSGVYIEGSWDNDADGLVRNFEGRPRPPVARPDERGLSITLTSAEGAGFVEGTPVIYRGVQVGRVANLRLSEDGVTVLADAFVQEPYDSFVTTTTRFWDTSGFDFSIGPQGATLNVSSLAALVQGGVAFDQFVEGGEAPQPGARFELYVDRAEAQSSVFAAPDDGERVRVSVIFEGDAAGLSAGAPVEYRGVRVGEVASVTGYVDEERFGDQRVRLLATVELQPDRLGLEDVADDAATLDFLSRLVAEEDLRAQLARASILTGGLRIDLVEVPDAEPAELEQEGEPYPVLPSVPADLPDMEATAQGVFERVAELPIEEFIDTAMSLLRNANEVAASDSLREAPDEAAALLSDLRGLVGSEGVQTLPDQAAETLAALETATTELTAVVEDVRAEQTVAALTAALEAAAGAADTVTALSDEAQPAVERIGGLADEATALVARADALPLEQLVAEASETVTALRTLVASPDLQEVPASVSATLAEVEGAVAELRAAGLAEQATQTLAAAEGAADTVSAADLPGLVARLDEVAASIEAVAQTAAGLPLEGLVADASEAATALRTLVASEEAQAVPADLSATLAEVEGAVAELRAAGLAEQATQTLAAAESAADTVSEATAGIPELVARLDALAATANELPLDATVGRANALLAELDTLLASEAVAELPRAATAALEEVRGTLAEARAAGLIASAQGALASAEQAADAVDRATAGLPGLVDDLSGLAGTANALPLERLTIQAAAAAEAAQALLSSQAATDLPGSLNAAVTEVEAALAELREGGLVENANATLDSASRAADAVAEASESLPALIARFDALSDEISGTLDTYDAEGELSREAREALRQVREAARSVSSLARSIERDPNSLLLGR